MASIAAPAPPDRFAPPADDPAADEPGRLDRVRVERSPRYGVAPTPWPSIAIHGAVAIAWLALFGCAFVAGGIWAWSAGVVYILYDTVLLAFTAWQTLRLARPPQPTAAPRGHDSVAVVVAARDEAGVLPTTLASLLAQREPPEAIGVADDGSIDGTAAMLVERFGFVAPAPGGWASSRTHPTVHWVRLAHGGKARALNAAIASPLAACRTDVVVTVDADTRLAPDAVSAMRRAFSADPALVAATGVLAPVCADTAAGRLFEWFQTYEYVRNFLSRYAWMRVDGLLLISGAFAGFRRDALVEVGGFEPDCLVEDYELIHRLCRHAALHRRGWRTAVVGAARAQTEAPASIGAFLRQRRRWFGGFLQTQYWYRGMVGDGRFGNVGRWMLPVKAIDTFQPVYGLAALAILLAALATGRFGVLIPVSGWIAAKIAIDLAFHLWSVRLYRNWVGGETRARFGWALVAALVEPFSFQILRHLGAALGWATFVTRGTDWGRQDRRVAVTAPTAPADGCRKI